MPLFGARAKHYTSVSARVIRADGTVEELGVIATDMPWWLRLWRKVTRHGKR